MSDINDLFDQLESLKASDVGPFPYEGCRWLQGVLGERGHDLVPDLDEYLSEVAGYRSWGKKILKWSDEKITAIQARLTQSFFDRFPRYADLKPTLVSSQACDVRSALHSADQTRALLSHLLRKIQDDRDGQASS